MTHALPAIAAARPRSRPARKRPPLEQASVLVLDADDLTGRMLRATLEQDYGADVEIATDYEAALDHLGNAARPTTLVMLNASLSGLGADALMALLRTHAARVAVTLHGPTVPEALPFPDNFVGAAAYTHQSISAAACATAEAVVSHGLTVHDIVARRRVPPTLDWQSAMAIYGAAPGQPFPLSLRT